MQVFAPCTGQLRTAFQAIVGLQRLQGGTNMSETTQKTDTVRSERNTARFGRYVFFKFRTGQRLASEYGVCSGQVDRRTGEILATITYGLFQYRETFKLNLSDPVHSFPYTIEDEIICAARKAVRLGGPMTRRRVVSSGRTGAGTSQRSSTGIKPNTPPGEIAWTAAIWTGRRSVRFCGGGYLFEVHQGQSDSTGGVPLLPWRRGSMPAWSATSENGRKLPPADSVLLFMSSLMQTAPGFWNRR